jgi:ketosteroid isomerase-like protein
MSQENVEVVRRVYDAFARQDDTTPYELYREDIVWDLSSWRRAALYAKPIYSGHAGVRENWRESLEFMGTVDFELVEIIDAGSTVVAEIQERAVGRSSGVPVEAHHWAVWTLTDAKIALLQVFDDHGEALKAAGLGE